MCDGFEVGSYGCGTCSLAPVGFWEKMPLLAKKITIVWNFIIKFTRSTLAVFLKPLEKSILKSGPPDNKKEIYINEIVKKKKTFT
jgi:hypothetical protein